MATDSSDSILALVETDPAPDVRALGRIAGGDRDALAVLYDTHASAVFGLLVRMLRDRAQAEEVLQDVFLQAWNQADRFRSSRGTPRGWLLTIARSRALDRLRSARARERRERESIEEGPNPRRFTPPDGPRELEQEERWQQLQGALGQLPSEQRQPIELAFFEGLSHSQVAARLDAPLGTVKSRILLGMKKLRTALAAYQP